MKDRHSRSFAQPACHSGAPDLGEAPLSLNVPGLLLRDLHHRLYSKLALVFNFGKHGLSWKRLIKSRRCRELRELL
jgi:hypothetical protein